MIKIILIASPGPEKGLLLRSNDFSSVKIFFMHRCSFSVASFASYLVPTGLFNVSFVEPLTG